MGNITWNRVNLYSTIMLFLSVILIASTFDGLDTPLKYLSITLMCLVLLSAAQFKVYDLISLSSLFLFVLFSLFFTLLNEPDYFGLFVWSGYFCCFVIYSSISNELVYDSLIKMISNFKWIALLFAMINIPYIFEPNAYTMGKGQFGGIIGNPNAFSAVCCLFIIINSCQLLNSESSKVHYVVTFILFIFVLLSFSRSSTISLFFALLLTRLNVQKKLLFVLFGLFTVALYLLVKSYLSEELYITVSQRDLYEDTGRLTILKELVNTLYNNYFILGTGLSELGGRVKRELSYFDIYTFSGIGFYFFSIYIIRTYYFLLKAFRFNLSCNEQIPRLIFVFVTTLSLFEGYAANVASILSILIYITSGLIYFQYYKYCRSHQC